LAVGGKKLSVFELPGKLADLVRRNGIIARIQTDAEWVDSLQGRKNLRVRFVGQKLQVEKGSPLASPDIAVYWGSTVESGRIELLPYFKEQAISITAHRFGNPAEQIQDLKL
jgi:RHH-type proline utilization regulon transcriptional repressor/proline dehydrogenase/delta 1-pyrroline-5-carboxylate dehydrogenase